MIVIHKFPFSVYSCSRYKFKTKGMQFTNNLLKWGNIYTFPQHFSMDKISGPEHSMGRGLSLKGGCPSEVHTLGP